MTTPSIMGYIPNAADSFSGVDTRSTLLDLTNNRIYIMTDNLTPANAGARQFTAYISGDESLAKSAAVISASIASINADQFAGCGLSYNGYILFTAVTGNSAQLALIKAADFSFSALFGTAGSSLSASTSLRILEPYTMCPLRSGGTDYIVSTSLSPIGEVCVLTVPGLVLTNLGNVTEALAVACGTTAAIGKAYALGKRSPSGYSTPNTDPLGIYSITPGALTRIGSVSPAQVDATWTKFNNAQGVAYDQTDGNLIIAVSTGDPVANTNYIVKVNATTAAVMWKLAVNVIDTNGDFNFNRHVIQNGTLYYLGNASLLYTITTATGAATTSTIGTLTVGNQQISEDINNSLIGKFTWNEGATHPNYIGTYMGTLGNHTLASQWGRYFPAGPTPPFASPSPSASVTNPVVSTNIAWTFVLDGHQFYVLDLGQEGTFLYDLTTKQWTNWITSGFANWDVVNGVQWNQRVVGGDFFTNDLWELQPGAVKDNGSQALEISHTCTGGLSWRSPEFVSLAALRISASFGQLDEVAGVNFNLRFSDDQGQTWSAYYPIALTEGNFSQQIAWTSLGSFAAPGRIFELSDSGGLIRIDGCDAFLNDFTEEAPPNEQ